MNDDLHHIKSGRLKSFFSRLLPVSGKYNTGKTADIMAHLASRETYNRKYLDEFLAFYNGKTVNRLAFFSAMAESEQFLVFAVLNKIFALMDTPELILTLRSHLRGIVKKGPSAGAAGLLPGLKKLDRLFMHYLENIFNYQYLILQEHTADNTPITLLKFIAAQEGVHPASHFANFEYRLNSPDRIVLSLSHFKLKRSPTVYIEIALAPKIIRNISSILSEERRIEDPGRCRVAVFYSVNKCIDGLEGVKLGEKMILKAVEYLRSKYPRLNTFVTLSPVPGFTDYLVKLSSNGARFRVPMKKHEQLLKDPFIRLISRIKNRYPSGISDMKALLSFLIRDRDWIQDREIRPLLDPFIYGLCRNYLLLEKRSVPGGEVAYDPVENFHMNNGAGLLNINTFANLSEKGIGESLGIMVNYIYDLDDIEKNRALYHNGRIIHRL